MVMFLMLPSFLMFPMLTELIVTFVFVFMLLIDAVLLFVLVFTNFLEATTFPDKNLKFIKVSLYR